MENGEKNEVMQEKLVVKKGSSNKDIQIVQGMETKFYGGADMRASRIRVVSDKPLPIEYDN